jgi:hypothetical protein
MGDRKHESDKIICKYFGKVSQWKEIQLIIFDFLVFDPLCDFNNWIKYNNYLLLHKLLNMKDFIRKHLFIILFSVAGALGGFLYWKFVGCQSGTCPIKSVWYLSTLWGLALGYLSGSIIKDIVVKVRNKKMVKVSKDLNQDQENI